MRLIINPEVGKLEKGRKATPIGTVVPVPGTSYSRMKTATGWKHVKVNKKTGEIEDVNVKGETTAAPNENNDKTELLNKLQKELYSLAVEVVNDRNTEKKLSEHISELRYKLRQPGNNSRYTMSQQIADLEKQLGAIQTQIKEKDLRGRELTRKYDALNGAPNDKEESKNDESKGLSSYQLKEATKGFEQGEEITVVHINGKKYELKFNTIKDESNSELQGAWIEGTDATGGIVGIRSDNVALVQRTPNKMSESDATLNRNRKDHILFKKPFIGKTGVMLWGYEWPNIKIEEVDKRGENVIRKYSDWSQADISEMTGRKFVHKFILQRNDGSIVTLSAESAAVALGISEQATRNKAKKLLEDEIEDQKKQEDAKKNFEAYSTNAWSNTPADAIENMSAFKHAWIKHKDWGAKDKAILEKEGYSSNYNANQTINLTYSPDNGFQALAFSPKSKYDSNLAFKAGWKYLTIPVSKIWDENGNPRTDIDLKELVRGYSKTWYTELKEEPKSSIPEQVATTKLKQEIKEPWQMTKKEWDTEKENLSPDVQSNFTRRSKNEAVSKMDKLNRLLFDVRKVDQDRIKQAQEGKIKLSKEELEEIMDRINTPIRHEDVIKTALSQGKNVPEDVLKEYPNLISREPKVISEEDYLSQNGAPFDFGDAGNHSPRGHMSNRHNKTVTKLQNEKDNALMNKRAELRLEYKRKIESGELREPTMTEARLKTAQGHEDLDATHAARRLLYKQGINYKTKKPFTNEKHIYDTLHGLATDTIKLINEKKKNEKEIMTIYKANKGNESEASNTLNRRNEVLDKQIEILGGYGKSLSEYVHNQGADFESKVYGDKK